MLMYDLSGRVARMTIWLPADATATLDVCGNLAIEVMVAEGSRGGKASE
jgi:hypothetical protein